MNLIGGSDAADSNSVDVSEVVEVVDDDVPYNTLGDGFCGDGYCDPASEDTCNCVTDCGSEWYDGCCTGNENCNNAPWDCGECCGDGSCDYKYGENTKTCCDDCGTECGDGKCNCGETAESCSEDCDEDVVVSSSSSNVVNVLKLRKKR